MTSKLSDSLIEHQNFEPSPKTIKNNGCVLATFGKMNSTINESSTIIHHIEGVQDLNQTDIYLT
jgi:hypothetical protein